MTRHRKARHAHVAGRIETGYHSSIRSKHLETGVYCQTDRGNQNPRLYRPESIERSCREPLLLFAADVGVINRGGKFLSIET